MRLSPCMARLATLATLALLWAGPSALAATSACPDQLAGGTAPDLLNPRLAQGTRELCYPGFVVLHSSATRTPLWSAENLTAARIRAARGTPRVNDFHADANLPVSERAELGDYVRSGYDRGHMSPSGDAPDAASQQATFTLGNMIPQNPDNNRNLWEGIEASVRNLALQDGQVYVVTGPIFAGSTIQALNGRVLVPTQIFKAVYDPAQKATGVYLVNNAAGMAWQPISVAQLRTLAGIDPFPALPESAKTTLMSLPLPEPHGQRSGVQPSVILAADGTLPAGVGGEQAGPQPRREGGMSGVGAAHTAMRALGYLLHH